MNRITLRWVQFYHEIKYNNADIDEFLNTKLKLRVFVDIFILFVFFLTTKYIKPNPLIFFILEIWWIIVVFSVKHSTKPNRRHLIRQRPRALNGNWINRVFVPISSREKLLFKLYEIHLCICKRQGCGRYPTGEEFPNILVIVNFVKEEETLWYLSIYLLKKNQHVISKIRGNKLIWY